MSSDTPTNRSRPVLVAELEELRAELAEAKEALMAIRSGGVDAVLVSGEGGEQVYTLRGADRIYRRLMDTMSEGAATVSSDGVILYGNRRLADMLERPLHHIVGTALRNHIHPANQQAIDAILPQTGSPGPRLDLNLVTSEGRSVPVALSVSRIEIENAGEEAICCFVFSDQQRAVDELRRSEALLSSAQQMARAGHWEYDVDRDVFTFNDNFYRIFRTTAAEVGG